MIKTNKMTFAPSEDSYQPGHPPSLIRVFHNPHEEALGPCLSVACTAETFIMRRLIFFPNCEVSPFKFCNMMLRNRLSAISYDKININC